MAKDEISARVTLEGGKEVTKELQGIGKEADKLDGTKIKVPVESDTKAARKDIEGLFEQVDKLGKFSGGIVLKDNAKDIERSISDLVIDLDKLDANDPEVDIKVGQINALEGDLDRVQTKLREINNVPIDADTRRATTGVDELGKSAGSSKNALANMVGNSAQDVANLGGIAGSTGVLIGQMAEFMADAKFEGEGLGGVIKNFAAVAGPAAALAVVVSTVTGFMAKQAAEAEAAAQRTDDFGKAMAGAADDSVGLADALRENLDPLREVNAGAEILGSTWAKTVNDMGRSIPLLGRMFQDTKVDAVDALDDTGLSIYQFTKAINGTEADRAKFISDLALFRDAGFITSAQYDGLVAATNQYAKSVDKARQAQHLMNVDLDEAQALLGEIKIDEDPFSKFQGRWNSLMDDLRDGKIDARGTADTINYLAEQLGKDPKEVLSLALGRIGDEADAANKQLDDNIKKIEEWRDTNLKAQQDVTEALDNITEQWQAMSDAVSEQSFADALDQFDSLSELDLSQVRQDTVGAFDDVKAAIKTAAGEVKGWGKMDLTPDSFEELKGMPAAFADITDAVSGMRGSIQTELKAAFDTGGVQAFSEKFDFFAGQVREQFTDLFRGMGLPEDQVQAQVQRILGDLSLLPKDKTILIKLTRDQEAKNTLDLFMADIAAIENANPSVDIRAKIAEGDIEGAYDELNALRISEGKEPIVLPTDAEQFGAATAAANARTRAQNYLNQHPALVPVGADGRNVPSDTMNARNDGQRTANANPIIIPVAAGTGFFRLPSGQILSDAGGTIPPGRTGIVAEKRPEIINGRYLITQPTVVPSGTRVTSGARTARILRRRGTRGLKPYDSGGTVAAGPSTVNVNFNGVGAIGSRFDLMRTVKRANLDRTRLLGTRG